jgi:vacuolar-type H+-ATPase subunit D/Vma8
MDNIPKLISLLKQSLKETETDQDERAAQLLSRMLRMERHNVIARFQQLVKDWTGTRSELQQKLAEAARDSLYHG